MGNCNCDNNEDEVNSEENRNSRQSIRSTGGKNQPLKLNSLHWKSDQPMTESQLRAKRDEFWDTAPAFEGRQEIWDALRAASLADHQMAQAILDGVSVILPNGTLTDCYDELGNRYELPLYVLAPPDNLLPDSTSLNCTNVEETEFKNDPGTSNEEEAARGGGVEMTFRFRLSMGRDFSLTARTTDTVAYVKKLVQAESGFSATIQRWFCYGQPLTDKLSMEECKVPHDFVIQVIVHHPDMLENGDCSL